MNAMAGLRRIVLFALFILVLSSRADAALIIFDMCTEASLCNELEFHTHLQPGGQITTSLENTFVRRVLSFGINIAPDATMSSGAALVSLGAGDVGPYGTFTDRFETPPQFFNYLLTFRDADGRFSDDLEPFFANSLGVFLAAEVLNTQTGTTGFVAARLVDASPVPEPGTMLLCASGLALIARRARRRRDGQPSPTD
jgi:hypothetical protein